MASGLGETILVTVLQLLPTLAAMAIGVVLLLTRRGQRAFAAKLTMGAMAIMLVSHFVTPLLFQVFFSKLVQNGSPSAISIGLISMITSIPYAGSLALLFWAAMSPDDYNSGARHYDDEGDEGYRR